MFRLIAYAPDGVRRFPLDRGTTMIGSREDNDICLPYTGVAQTHAQLRYDGETLLIEDLGSRKGVLVGGRRVRESALEMLDEVRLGSVTLLVEEVTRRDVELPPVVPVENEPVSAADRASRITPQVMLDHLAEISDWVLADVESRTPLESLVGKLLNDFGGGALFLLHGELAEEPGIKFVSVSNAAWLGSGEELLAQVRENLGDLEAALESEGVDGERGGAVLGTLGGEPSWVGFHVFRAVERQYLLIVALPSFEEGGWSPVSSLRALGHLLVLGLVHHVGWYEPILPGRQAQKELTLDPALVVGESASMKAVLDQLRVAADPDIHVLMRGEPGSGLQMLARSLHLSSSRRLGPFVVASCSGAQPAAIEADLFGAEVAGKEGPVRREGKLVLADGGTLYLQGIEKLPARLQDRVHRFLRSGEVEPGGTHEAIRVNVRIVATAREPLEPLAGRDLFRVDLAYQLSRFTIDVPSLRQRREDLPLLIQSYVNRFCHETGKRMRGITVKAMSALLAYDFPGNLEELENISRQLVYLCPPGQPLDLSQLPEKVRLSTIQAAARVDFTSDLDLDHLVGATERAAIREALRRCHGNKSQAARLLGLSRNGLALKMQRRGLSAS